MLDALAVFVTGWRIGIGLGRNHVPDRLFVGGKIETIFWVSNDMRLRDDD